MPKKIKSPLDVPQTDDQWYCAVRKLRTFVAESEGSDKYVRPFLLLIVDVKTSLILGMDAVLESVSAHMVYQKLADAMVRPVDSVKGPAHRPALIHFEDEALMEAVRPLLAELEVKVFYQTQRQGIDEIVKELEKSLSMFGEGSIPGLLQQPGVTPEMVGSLFAAARDFYRAEPWTQLFNLDILAVQLKGQKSPYYVSVMGNGGEEYGLAVYREWEDVGSALSGDPFRNFPKGGHQAFLFNTVPEVSIDDLDAIDAYGWELPEPGLVPTPIVYMVAKAKRPDVTMLRWYEAALRAIPNFVAKHLETKPDGAHPAVEADIQVQTLAGKKMVHIRYPGGDISELEIDEDEDEDWDEDLNFDLDLREAEGKMAAAAASFGASSEFNDPALQQAQQLMYDAWEAKQPARRLALAKKALQLSPNCADAYVLLAEEEAKTNQQALELYQAGVEAGRRGLGEDFFNDPNNIGNFWGILETRPYMRAMQGLAHTLEKMGRGEEAVPIYREMLRLNPNDNQGNRYLLLDLLLDIGQNEEARALLQAYQGDWSATWAYATALLAYRENGDSPDANQALTKALGKNKHVLPYLTGVKRLPLEEPEFITPGEEDEAIDYARRNLNQWRKTPGAVDWLKTKNQRTFTLKRKKE